jgi:tRNA dimethylallyltransferase
LGPQRLYARLAASDPVAAARIDPGNVRRTVRALEVPAITGRAFSTFAHAWERYDPGAVRVAGLRMPRSALVARIDVRVRSMLDAGWLQEVGSLVQSGFGGWLTSTQAIGYADLRGDMTLEAAVESTVKRTGNLARRQMSWFRRDPRVRWFDVDERGATAVLEPILTYLSRPWEDV